MAVRVVQALLLVFVGVATPSGITLTSDELVVVLDPALPRPISVKYSKVDLSPPGGSPAPAPTPGPTPAPNWWRMVENECLVVSGNPLNQTEFPTGTTNPDGANKVFYICTLERTLSFCFVLFFFLLVIPKQMFIYSL